jgi:predicted alpha/beta hydrolase
VALRAGGASYGPDGYYQGAYPRTHHGLSTNVPKEVAEDFADWCKHGNETQRDVLASMIQWFLEHETTFQELLDDLRATPKPI